MSNQNRQRAVLHEGRESRVLFGVGDPNGVQNADKGTFFVQTNTSPLTVWVNNNDQAGWEVSSGAGGCPDCECVEDSTLFYDDFESYFIQGINGESIIHSDVHWVSSPSGVDDATEGGGWIRVFTNLRTPQQSFIVGPVANPLKMTTRVFSVGTLAVDSFIGFQSPFLGPPRIGFRVDGDGTLILVVGGTEVDTNISLPNSCETAMLLELIADTAQVIFRINGSIVGTLPVIGIIANVLMDFRWDIIQNGGVLFVDMVCIRGPRRCMPQT